MFLTFSLVYNWSLQKYTNGQMNFVRQLGWLRGIARPNIVFDLYTGDSIAATSNLVELTCHAVDTNQLLVGSRASKLTQYIKNIQYKFGVASD